MQMGAVIPRYNREKLRARGIRTRVQEMEFSSIHPSVLMIFWKQSTMPV